MAESTDTTTDAPKEYEKGTWQGDLHQSATLADRASKGRARASLLLWTGAKKAIDSWLPGSDNDVSAESLYGEVVEILGNSRKGDASKIKTVAIAVKHHGLAIGETENLSKAYAEAVRLTRTVQEEKAEDTAADQAVESIAAEAPKTATTTEAAAKILLAKGLDEAARAVLDALGADNAQVHRAFLRAVSQEINGRVKAAKPEAKAGPKDGAVEVGAKVAATKAKPRSTTKPAGQKAAPKEVATKAAPTRAVPSVSKGDPNKRVLPSNGQKAAPVKRAVPKATPKADADA